MAQTEDLMIQLQGVRKAFGPKVVLNHLDLTVRRGESLTVIGGSGSGKSVLLKHIIGLMQPDAGTVVVDGVDLAGLGNRELIQFRRRYGMAFQEGALFDSMTVYQNISFPLQRARSLNKQQIEERVQDCLELVGLVGTGDKMPAQLSGGMRRRVGFARAIALEPQILLFDEPTTGLDPVMTAMIDEVILSLQRRLGCTTVTITHDMKSAFRIADRIAMLYQGQIIAMASPEEFQQLDDPRVQQFLEGRSEGPLTDPTQ